MQLFPLPHWKYIECRDCLYSCFWCQDLEECLAITISQWTLFEGIAYTISKYAIFKRSTMILGFWFLFVTNYVYELSPNGANLEEHPGKKQNIKPLHRIIDNKYCALKFCHVLPSVVNHFWFKISKLIKRSSLHSP